MRTISKLAHVGTAGHRSPLTGVLDHVKRALAPMTDRRVVRPLQDLDSWSDQAEVAFYEDCRTGRCLI